MVGKVSTADLAGASVLIRIADILGILSTAVGTTAATLVSRTIGEGDVNKAAEWAWDAAKIGVGVITLIGLPLLIWPHYFLSIFLSSPDTIAIAEIPLQLVAATSGIASLIFVFSYTLLSLGDGNRVILVSFSTQWLLFLPAVWIVGPYLRHGLLSMYIVQTIYGAIATVLILAVWMDGRWKTIKI
jgi:Na+-driven multidrug efflux pump